MQLSEDELKDRIIALFDRCGGEIKAIHRVDRHALLGFAKELVEQSYAQGLADAACCSTPAAASSQKATA